LRVVGGSTGCRCAAAGVAGVILTGIAESEATLWAFDASCSQELPRIVRAAMKKSQRAAVALIAAAAAIAITPTLSTPCGRCV